MKGVASETDVTLFIARPAWAITLGCESRTGSAAEVLANSKVSKSWVGGQKGSPRVIKKNCKRLPKHSCRSTSPNSDTAAMVSGRGTMPILHSANARTTSQLVMGTPLIWTRKSFPTR